ncbi:MAG: Mov34/MPN/PAD-1 family protein [Pyrinomonadaceae bacterium]
MIQLRLEHFESIVVYAQQSAPAECCGLVSGDSAGKSVSIYPLQNVAPNAELAYEAAPEQLFQAQRLMRERGQTLLAIYHSHPRAANPQPSDTDVRLAYYPSAIYLIVGLGADEPVVKAFQISEREQAWQSVEYALTGE